MERLHCKNLNANVNLIADVEGKMFHKQVIGDEGIFAELDFNGDSIFYEIRLVMAENRRLARCLDF